MKTVYICSKFCGATKKFYINANIYCRFAWEKGYLPLAPRNIIFQFLDEEDKKEKRDGFEIGLELMKIVDEVWVIDVDITKSMTEEIEFAKSLKKKLRYFDGEMEEYDGRNFYQA
jgi:hypothetical protein